MTAGHRAGCSDYLIDSGGQGIRIGVPGTADDAGVGGVRTVQPLEIATVKGENDPPGGSGVSQDPSIVASLLAGLLHGQYVMPQGPQPLGDREIEIFVGVEPYHPGLTPPG